MQAASHPLYLWKIESPTARVFIAGSFHTMKPGLVSVPKQFDQALAQSDTIVVESNISSRETEEKTKKFIQAHGMVPADKSLLYFITGETYRKLQHRCTKLGKDISPLMRLKPTLVASYITATQIEQLGFSRQHGLEQYCLSRASGRKIIELEEPEDQYPFCKVSNYTQGEYLAEVLNGGLDKSAQNVEKFAEMWNSGNDEAILNSFCSSYSHATQKRIGDETRARNEKMAKKIEALLQKQGTYFFLPGCIHTLGKESVIEKLQKRGFSSTRYNSTDEV